MNRIDENRSAHANRWVAVEGDRLIAGGTDPREIFTAAKAEGIESPFVVSVLQEGSLPSFHAGRMPVSLDFDASHPYRGFTDGINGPAALCIGGKARL